MNILFMGTPVFAVPCLDAIISAGHNVTAVFTQPDKPKNRGHKVQMTPVKEYAVSKQIEVFQPLSLRKGDDAELSLNTLKQLNPDCIVVVAYGQILPKSILDLPKYGCVNVHASLLPKYRGAAPIQWCVINGEEISGVTTMYMADGIDTGDMLLKEEVVISKEMTGSDLHDKLSECGAKLIVETLSQLEQGTICPTKQDDSLSCYASMISKEMCKIDFTKPAIAVYNQIRGLSSVPCAFTFMGEKRLKVYFAQLSNGNFGGKAGEIVDENNFTVACGDGKAVILKDIQLEGGKRLSVTDFLRGKKLDRGFILG